MTYLRQWCRVINHVFCHSLYCTIFLPFSRSISRSLYVCFLWFLFLLSQQKTKAKKGRWRRRIVQDFRWETWERIIEGICWIIIKIFFFFLVVFRIFSSFHSPLFNFSFHHFYSFSFFILSLLLQLSPVFQLNKADLFSVKRVYRSRLQ